MSAQNSGFTQDDNQEIEQLLTDIDRALSELQERHAQVKRDYQRRSELEQQQKDNQTREPIKTQLRHIQQELDNLEINLESRLLNWQPFWQAVRIGGLGVIIGWLLKSWAS